jgi:hypothetical protein
MMSDGSSSYRRGCRDFCRCRLDRAQCAAQLCAGELRWHGVSTMRQYLVSAPGVPVRRGQSTVLMSGRNGPQNFGVQSNVGFQQRIPDSGFFRFCAMRRPRSECATSLTRRRSCAQFAICFSRPRRYPRIKKRWFHFIRKVYEADPLFSQYSGQRCC